MAKIIGRQFEVQRFVTGLHSFDRAFSLDGEVGMPLNVGWEMFGVNHTGKTTVSLSLAARIAQGKSIVFCDFEETDPKFVLDVVESQGFDGNVYVCQGETDEEMIEDLIKQLKSGEYAVGIVDSIAAISPIPEQSGSVGEANMGRRARIVAQLSRKSLPLFRGEKGTLIYVNHWYPVLGGSRAWDTPGGEAKKYFTHVRVHLLQDRKSRLSDGSYVIRGTVKKNKRGGSDDLKFLLAVKGGQGISRNLTALFDCKELGLAKKHKTVKLGDQDFGYLKTLVENHDDDELFAPFHKALAEHTS